MKGQISGAVRDELEMPEPGDGQCGTRSVGLKNIICSSEELLNFYFFPGLLNSHGTAVPNSLEA